SCALIAMRCCIDAGIRIPNDIAIVGCDDIAAAALAHPPLTTIRIDKEKLGASGVRLLLQNHGDTPQQQVLPVSLVVRDSAPTNKRTLH
ncbi:substrate-binding domain-containing protein, partial [Pseudomonas sp. RTS4]